MVCPGYPSKMLCVFAKYTFECENRGRESHVLPAPAPAPNGSTKHCLAFSKLKILIGHTELPSDFLHLVVYILLFTLVLFNQDVMNKQFEVFSGLHFGNNAEVITCQDILRHLWVYP